MLSAVAFLLLVPVVLFLPCLFLGQALFGFDYLVQGLPFMTAIQHNLSLHESPLWMPDILGGLPGIASCNLEFTHPVQFLLCLPGMSVPMSFGWNAAIHVALAGLGMLFFLRQLGVSISGALLGAFFYAVSGTVLSGHFGGYSNMTMAAAMVPWAFLAAHRGMRSGSRFAWGLAGLAFALQVLAVGVQIFAYTFPAVAVFAVALAWQNRRDHLVRLGSPGPSPSYGSAALGLALSLLVVFLISAPQSWLTAQYLPYSVRQAVDYKYFSDAAMGPQEAITWFVPGFYGWHQPSYDGPRGINFVSDYLGLLPWALAAAALWAGSWRRQPLLAWMAGLAVLATIVACGPATPLFKLFFHLPIYSGFRTWSRILFLVTFAICTLAAFGWDELVGIASKKAWLAAAAVCGATLAAAALAWQLAEPAAAKAALDHELLVRLGSADTVHQTLLGMARASALRTAWLVPFVAAALWWASRKRSAGLALFLLIGFHAYDLRDMQLHFLYFRDPAPYTSLDLPGIKALLPPPGVEPWRVHAQVDGFPNDPILFGYETLEGRESMAMLSSTMMEQAMLKRPKERFDLMGVKWFLGYAADPKHLGERRLELHRNDQALPRARLLTRVRKVSGDAQAWALLGDPTFDLRHEVTLEIDPGLTATGAARGSVKWLSRTPNTYSMAVDVPQDSVLVVSNSWYPSWRCKVDGQDAAVLKAYGGLQAVVLRAGAKRVEFRFDAGLFHAALAAAVLGLCLLGALAALEWRAPR